MAHCLTQKILAFHPSRPPDELCVVLFDIDDKWGIGAQWNESDKKYRCAFPCEDKATADLVETELRTLDGRPR